MASHSATSRVLGAAVFVVIVAGVLVWVVVTEIGMVAPIARGERSQEEVDQGFDDRVFAVGGYDKRRLAFDDGVVARASRSRWRAP
jgi:hypothetical protein